MLLAASTISRRNRISGRVERLGIRQNRFAKILVDAVPGDKVDGPTEQRREFVFQVEEREPQTVSYTHLTLPTIYSV